MDFWEVVEKNGKIKISYNEVVKFGEKVDGLIKLHHKYPSERVAERHLWINERKTSL